MPSALLEARLVELERLGVLRDRPNLAVVEARGVGCLDLDAHDQLGSFDIPEVGDDLVGDVLEVQNELVGVQGLAAEEACLELAVVDTRVLRILGEVLLRVVLTWRLRSDRRRLGLGLALLGRDIRTNEQ